MIYTCTCNPSLDYYLTLEDEIQEEQVSRSIREYYECGGKGINISIMLSNLGISSNCLGFLGGFTKDIYTTLLTHYPNIQPLFTTIKGNTRINVKIQGVNETSINAKGPEITEDEFNKFKSRVTRIYDDDYFVLSGNIQEELKEKVQDLVKELSEEGIKVVLDCTEDVLNNCLEYKPFFANVTHMISFEDNEENIKEKLLEQNKKGLKNAVVCKRNCPSYFCSDGHVYKCEVNKIETYVTGYIDSMIAGFLFTSIRGGNAIEAFHYGQACAYATAESNDLASREKAEECYRNIEITEI